MTEHSGRSSTFGAVVAARLILAKRRGDRIAENEAKSEIRNGRDMGLVLDGAVWIANAVLKSTDDSTAEAKVLNLSRSAPPDLDENTATQRRATVAALISAISSNDTDAVRVLVKYDENMPALLGEMVGAFARVLNLVSTEEVDALVEELRNSPN